MMVLLYKVIDNKAPESLSLPARIARTTARNPYKSLLGSIIFSLVFSAIGIIGGNFKVEVDNKGWRSRGTLIANREMQNEVILRTKNDLFNDVNGSVWEDVENNVVQGFVALDDRGDGEGLGSRRKLIIDGCNADKYYSNLLAKDNLYAVYKTDSEKSILDSDVLFDICESETATQQVLEEKGLCGGCDDSQCLPPHSLLLVLRLSLNGLDLSCSELKERYTASVQENFTNTLVKCTQGIYESYDSITRTYVTPDVCPPLFQVNLVDQSFGIDGENFLRYSTSYFITYSKDKKKLFKAKKNFSYTDTNLVSTTYDTFRETLSEAYIDSLLIGDMVSQMDGMCAFENFISLMLFLIFPELFLQTLAVGSMMITCIAMGIHTKSVFLTIVGIFQIIFSVPLAYFVYYFILGIRL